MRPDQLEHELNKILDVAHAWGAVLLLDEADVFLGESPYFIKYLIKLNNFHQRHVNHKTYHAMPL